jgi:hypothetical protein
MKYVQKFPRQKMARQIRDYGLLFLLIGTSGMPFFAGKEFILMGFILSLCIFLYLDKRLTPNFLKIAGAVFFVEFLQFIVYEKIGFDILLSTLMRLLFVYFVVRIIGTSFTTKFVNVIYWIAVISLVLYPLLFFPGAVNYVRDNIAVLFPAPFENTNTFYQASPSIILWTIHPIHSYAFRNSGAFWEPGGFGVFLLLAMLFHFQKEGIKLNKKQIVFSIAIITTISTMAFIAFFIIMYYVFFKKMHLFFKVILIPVFCFFGYLTYSSLDFLGEKIANNITVADETTASRFGSALADFELIKESPIIGWGRGTNRYKINSYADFDEDDHRNNGITNLAVTYGIPMAIMLFFMYFFNFKEFASYYKGKVDLTIPFLLVLLVCSFSQVLFIKSIFISLVFFKDVYQKVKYRFKIAMPEIKVPSTEISL